MAAIRVLPAGSPWVTGLFFGQAILTCWFLGARLPLPYRILAVLLTVVALGLGLHALGSSMRSAGMALGGVCHALAYGGLLAWFAASLRPGHEPAITGFARQMRRTMPPEVVRYTRRVTVAWSAFFAAQLLVSLGLLLVAPEAAWADFVSVWNLPLVVTMAALEFACRAALFRRHQRTGIVATLAAMRHIRGLPGGLS